MSQLHKIASVILGLSLLAACTSKFQDKEPEKTNTNGFTVDGANGDLDKKLARLEDNAEKIRKLIRAFRRVQGDGQGSYTQIDFILDVNDQLAQAPSHQEGRKFVRESKVKLQIKELSPECQTIETRLDTLSQGGTVDTNLDDNGIPVDGVTYSVRTCKSEGQFLPIATVTFASTGTSLDFNNDNIRKTLADVITPVIQLNTNCQLNVDAQNVLAHGSCTNLTSKLSPNEKLVIENLVYDRYDAVRFQLQGKILGNDEPKAIFTFSVDANGKVKSKLDKVN